MLKADTLTRSTGASRPRPPSRPLRLLVVEDEQLSAEAVCMAVSDLGHTVCGTAATEAEAVEIAARVRPDVALMDVRLAGGDGIAAARRLHTDHGIRSIFLSGYADHGVMARITETYPLGVVHKPFSHGQLKVVLDLAARRLR
ncbi:response regulator [Azospirillum agricola]|uniref:response regulator n=1 Tax=Azospirillum agricola TaxID=1720247 RepID=UPI000A0F0409|nr:response regulator [Azospirillum agricola]SMH59899.1 Response regulator receiver domain-containing protein [Azospirillum lipoferum]